MGRLNAKRSPLDADVPSSGISFVLQKSDSDSFNAGYNKRTAVNKKHTMVQPLVWKEVCHCMFLFVYSFSVPNSNGTLSDKSDDSRSSGIVSLNPYSNGTLSDNKINLTDVYNHMS